MTAADGRARYAAIGFVGGLLSGLLGIGGGTAMVPLLVYWLSRQQRVAHAMSLAAIIPISLALPEPVLKGTLGSSCSSPPSRSC